MDLPDVGAATNELEAPARWWSLSLGERIGQRVALRLSVPSARPVAKTWLRDHMTTI
jgi:hypothetical protein